MFCVVCWSPFSRKQAESTLAAKRINYGLQQSAASSRWFIAGHSKEKEKPDKRFTFRPFISLRRWKQFKSGWVICKYYTTKIKFYTGNI